MIPSTSRVKNPDDKNYSACFVSFAFCRSIKMVGQQEDLVMHAPLINVLIIIGLTDIDLFVEHQTNNTS